MTEHVEELQASAGELDALLQLADAALVHAELLVWADLHDEAEAFIETALYTSSSVRQALLEGQETWSRFRELYLQVHRPADELNENVLKPLLNE